MMNIRQGSTRERTFRQRTLLSTILLAAMAGMAALVLAGCPMPGSLVPRTPADLVALHLENPSVALSPGFASDVTTYSATVAGEVTEITVSAIVADPQALVEGTGVRPLAEGANDIVVTVSAADGSQKSYLLEVTRATLLETVAAPTFTPIAGTYDSGLSVTIATATDGATIRYTTAEAAPSQELGTVYTGAIAVAADTIIRAIAFKDGWNDSPVAVAEFVIDETPPIAPGSPGVDTITSTSIALSWAAGTDERTTEADLSYTVLTAPSASALDTIAEAAAIGGAGIVMDWTANTLGRTVSGLTPQTSYWFAVLVRDSAGNCDLYEPASFATTAPVLVTAAAWAGYNSSNASFPQAAAQKAIALISAASHAYSGVSTYYDNRCVWAFDNGAAALDPATAPYLSYTIELATGYLTLDRFVLSGMYVATSGGTPRLQLRWSVDGYSSSLGEFAWGPSYSLSSIDLSSKGTVAAGSIQFRVYYYDGAGSSWNSTTGPYASVDGTSAAYDIWARNVSIWALQ